MKNFISIFLLLTITAFSQVTQEWVARYTGSGGASSEGAKSIAIDGFGNVYVTGVSIASGGIVHAATIKYNATGVQQWVASFNPQSVSDFGSFVAVDTSGNTYVTGVSVSDSVPWLDYTTVKYNADGVQQWMTKYNGPGNGNDEPHSMVVDNDGNVYVTGVSEGDHFVTGADFATIKYNSAGVQQWVARYNGPASLDDAGTSVAVDNVENVYVTGISYDLTTGGDYHTIKYNAAGVQQWLRTYSSPGTVTDIPRSLAVDNSGNVYVTGNSAGDFGTIKYNSSGIQQWVAIYNGPGSAVDDAISLAVDDSGNTYVTGRSNGGSSTQNDYATVKYDSAGAQQWVARYNGPGSGNDEPKSLAIDNNEGMYVTGSDYEGASTGVDYATVKYNTAGVEQWVARYNGPGGGVHNDQPTSMAVDNEGNVYVTGSDYGGASTGVDYATIKYSQKPRYPVLIVPGIAGTYAADVNSDLEWLVTRGISPDKIQVDPLANVYQDLITTLENVGYEKDKDLFVVNYDWRVLPAPLDNNFDGYIDGITGTSITDDEFKYGVDYLGWYIKKACDRWRTDHDEELDSIDIISHSTGGLLTRAYIQSSAYGGIYDAANNYKLAKIRNFIMIGVPNRGAAKAWNPLHDNWISDVVYRFVLSKIINRAFQKLKKGYIITGPDYTITWGSILDSLGNPNKELFIKKYVPTIRGLLATFDFIDFGNGVTNVNSDSLERNSLILDLNNGYDLDPNADPNHFLDSTFVKVLYGTSNETFDYVVQRNDPEINALQSFTDWTRSSVFGGTIWYKDLASGQNNGDETVPIVSSVGQFLNDSRAVKIPFSISNHTGMVSTIEVQSSILDILNVNYDQGNIATGSSEDLSNVLNVISDPVELFVTDGIGRRLGYSNSTGKITEIPNSTWIGNTEGMGYVFGSVVEPINLQLTGVGEDYYVMVSVEDSGNGGGIMVEGYLALGEVANYQITLNPLSVDQIKSLTPENFELAQNYPNPFNPTTTIQYSIPQRSNVTLKVYDVLGNEVATLIKEEKERGVYMVNFNASGLASGIYFYRLQAGIFTQTKKLVIIK